MAIQGSLEYVCWLDLMGAKNIMRRSLPQAANAVLKLHDSALKRITDGSWTKGRAHQHLSLQPVIDGVYIRASQRWEIESFLRAVMADLARSFIAEDKDAHRNLFRAGISFGPVIDASDPSLASRLSSLRGAAGGLADAYLSNIAIGMALTHAYESESMAPPYGVYVHESARAIAPVGEKPFPGVWFHWWKGAQFELSRKLSSELERYYDWAEKHQLALLYPPDRMKVHRERATEYFLGEGNLVADGEDE